MYLPPEPGWDKDLERRRSESSGSTFFLPKRLDEMYEYLPSPSGSGPTLSSEPNHTDTTGKFRKNKGWTRTAKVRTPKAYNEVRQALLFIEEDLPEEWRTNWLEWDGKVQAWHFNGARKDIISLVRFFSSLVRQRKKLTKMMNDGYSTWSWVVHGCSSKMSMCLVLRIQQQ